MKNWTPDLLLIWNKLTQPALTRAGEALSTLTAEPVTLAGIRTRTVAWPELETMLQLSDPHRDLVYAAHLGAFGLFAADILLLFTETAVAQLVTVLLGEPAILPIDELGVSALAEVGNIIGTAFLNVFADTFHQSWEPTPPEVTVDYLTDLIGRIFPHWHPEDEVLLSEALLTLGEAKLEGYLAVVPRWTGTQGGKCQV